MPKNRRRSAWPLLLVGIGVAIIALALGLALLRPWTENQNGSGIVRVEGPYPEVGRVTLRETKEAFDTGRAVFVDVRDRSEYVQGHIPGALSIPLFELLDRIGELSPENWIITY
jgi:hypothetical protein